MTGSSIEAAVAGSGTGTGAVEVLIWGSGEDATGTGAASLFGRWRNSRLMMIGFAEPT